MHAEVRVVSFLFRQGSHLIHEKHGAGEIDEVKALT
jgi:hypothetical protein